MACSKEDLPHPTSPIIPKTSPCFTVKFIFFKVTSYCTPLGIGICILHPSLIISPPSTFPSFISSFSFFSVISSSKVGLSLFITKGSFKSLILFFVFL